MPTITIRTGQLTAVQRRAIAVRLTRWLAEAGSKAAHVTVCFEESPAGTVFSGGMPAEALAAGQGALPVATVLCRISPDRDQQFRHDLARELVRLLPGGEQMPLVYVEFLRAAPADVWIANHGQLWCADQPEASAGRPEGWPAS